MALSITSPFNCFFMQIQANIKMSYFPLFFFPQKVVYCFHCSALLFWSILHTTYWKSPHIRTERASAFFLCDTMWFWWKTQPFVVQPGSGDTSGLLYLSLWSLWEWGANWINVCLSARSFYWGMLWGSKLEIREARGKKREENLSGQKHFQMVLDVTHKRKTKQFSCVPAESATRVSPKIVASQKSVPS